MATGVDELLDMLFEMIDEAKSLPLSSDKCIVERDKALDLLDEIRAQFPMELAEERSRELRRAANEYCEDVMRRVEEALSEAHGEVQRSRTKFRALASGAAAQGGSRQPYDAEAEGH